MDLHLEPNNPTDTSNATSATNTTDATDATDDANTTSWPAGSSYCDLVFGPDVFDEDLKKDAERLFATEDDAAVRCIDVGVRSKQLRDEQMLLRFLEQPKTSSIRIFTIGQLHALRSLNVTERMLRRVFQHLDALPVTVDLIRAFGHREQYTSQGVGKYMSMERENTDRTDFCYILTTPEVHGRDHLSNPWSVRQFLVYERLQTSTKDSSFLVINPSASETLKQRLKMIRSTVPASFDSITIHAFCVFAATQNWSRYVTYLEQELYDPGVRSNIGPVAARPDPGNYQWIKFEDIQILHKLQEGLQQSHFMLRGNCNIIEALLKARTGPGIMGYDEQSAISCFRTSLTQMRTQMQRVEMLIGRADALSTLSNNIISFRTMNALRISSEETTNIYQLAQIDSSLMVELSRKASQDTKTLKTITILTLIYLPASFVSTLLSMGYISIETHGSNVSIDFKPEMLIFLVLTVVLLTITIGLWLVVDRRMKRAYNAKSTGEEEKSSSLV